MSTIMIMKNAKVWAAVALLALAGCSDNGLSSSSSAICVGAATPCSELSSVECGRAQGCAPGVCSGSATACAALTSASSCAIQEGCRWDAPSGACTGTVEACARFASSATCVGQGGCSWTDGCSGWPAECEALSSLACTAQPGCHIKVVDGGAGDVSPTPDSGPPSYCAGAFQPAPGDMIDDMEDGDFMVGPKPGWTGNWYTYDDMTASGQIQPAAGGGAFTMEPIPGGRCGSMRAMRMTGSGFTDWGAGMGMAFAWGTNSELPFDFSQYDGIVFWLRMGEGATDHVRVNIADKDTAPEGGVCDSSASPAVGKGCYDHWGVTLTDVGTEWKQYKIKFSSMAQSMFGLQVPAFDPTSIYDVQFQVGAGVLFDIWIDDLAFTRP